MGKIFRGAGARGAKADGPVCLTRYRVESRFFSEGFGSLCCGGFESGGRLCAFAFNSDGMV
jgi:hypothetical protein